MASLPLLPKYENLGLKPTIVVEISHHDKPCPTSLARVLIISHTAYQFWSNSVRFILLMQLEAANTQHRPIPSPSSVAHFSSLGGTSVGYLLLGNRNVGSEYHTWRYRSTCDISCIRAWMAITSIAVFVLISPKLIGSALICKHTHSNVVSEYAENGVILNNMPRSSAVKRELLARLMGCQNGTTV